MTELTAERNEATALENPELPAQGQPMSEETAQLRLLRIHEYLEDSLSQQDKLQRCLAPLMCDLLEMCQQLKAGIDQHLSNRQSFIAVLREIEPAFQMYLTMLRQIDRFAQLETRARGK